MANWWEEGAFGQPGVSSEEMDNPAAEHAAPAFPWADRLSDVDWRGVAILGVVALLVVAVRGFDLWRGRQLASEARRNALRQVIASELSARRQGDEAAYRSMLDPEAEEQWRDKQLASLTVLPLPTPSEEPPVIERWEFRDDTVMVDLRFAGPPAVRETRFYRLIEDSWYRTPPVAAYWGGRQEAGAPGVHFVYREADAQAAQGTAEALRTAHQQGNVSVLAGQRLTVEIVPDYVVEYDSRQNHLTLPSPRLSPRLASVPDSVPLLWYLAHPIADRLADPSDSARYRYLDSLQLLQDHLRYWPMRWQAPFPERWQTQMLETLRTAKAENRLISPRAIDVFAASRPQLYLAYFETMTMADYIAEDYGPDALFAFEQVLTQMSAWDRAVQAGLGVEVSDFERGWQTYLDSRLASSPAVTPQTTPTVEPTPVIR